MAGATVRVRLLNRPGSFEEHVRLSLSLLCDDYELIRQKLATGSALPFDGNSGRLSFLASELKAYKIEGL